MHIESSENRVAFFFIFGGVPQAYEVCCVTMYNEKG